MQNKLQELTKKIYKEGISKGNEEAQSIINNAKKEAEEIKVKLKKRVDRLKKKGITPLLAIIMVGDNTSSKIYVRKKQTK